MAIDPLSTLCVGRLTSLLELSSLEDLQILEDCAYVAQNIELEENHFHAAPMTSKNVKSTTNQVKNLFKFLSRRETPRVFGQQISEGTVEFIIQHINYLKLDTGVEGLFRISGNKKRQEELKVIMNKGGKLNLSAEDSPYSPHDIAGVLKQFFGQLPEPLLTKQLYDCYQQLAEMDSVSAKKRKIDTLKFLFLLLPPLNRLLLKELIKLLAVVADNNLNKMSAYNLGVVFAPNIVCTRQPLDSLSEFTENVEPFTELVKFVIENAEEVFQIPVEFLEECKEYLLKIAVNKEKDAEVPMTRSYCQQIDEKAFRKEAKDNTNEAVMLLYSQMMDMPDGPMKDNFLQKFRLSYPGTPLFIPKSIKEMSRVSTSTDDVNASRYPMTPKSTSNAIRIPASLSKKSCSLPGLMTPVGSKNNSSEILMSASKAHNTPSTPGQKVKQCLKRIRRRSVELFKPKLSKPATPDVKRKSLKHSDNSMSSIRSRANSFFSSTRFSSNSKGMKKSVSSPSLLNRSKQNISDDESHNNIGVRKLNFGSETGLYESDINRSTADHLVNKGERPVSFTYGDNKQTGFINFAFQDTPDQTVASKVTTPIIRKSLYPDTKKKIQTNGRHFGGNQQKGTVLKEKFEFQAILAPKPQYPTHSCTPSYKENFQVQPPTSAADDGVQRMNKLPNNSTSVNDPLSDITNEEGMKVLSLNGNSHAS